MNLNEIPLGHDGLAYVKSCLDQGTGLCTKILELSCTDGTAFAPVPEHVNSDRAASFDEGGLMNRRDIMAWFAEHLQKTWATDTDGTLVIQDVWAKPTDPAAQNSDLKKFFQGENVYYYCEKADLNAHWIQKAFRAVTSYLFVAVYSQVQVRDKALPSDRMVDEGLIDELARGVREVYVSAYDQEGLVVWRRSVPTS